MSTFVNTHPGRLFWMLLMLVALAVLAWLLTDGFGLASNGFAISWSTVMHKEVYACGELQNSFVNLSSWPHPATTPAA